MKNMTLFISIFILIFIPSSILAQNNVDYKVPKKLAADDFRTPEDKDFLKKFDEIKIPVLMRKIVKTDEEYIIPWLRESTAEAHNYQITIRTMRRGVLVTDKQFAWVKKEVDTCAKILHLSPTPRVFIVGKGGMQAEAVNFGEPFILLPSELVEKSSPGALRFVIGRQMGHIKCDHVFYHTLSSGGLSSLEFALGVVKAFLGKVSDLLLVNWTLASAISADRAGLIACQNLQVAQKTLLNFQLAIPSELVELNVEDYLEQARIIADKQAVILEKLPASMHKGFDRWQRSERLAADYPFIFERIRALQEYAASDAYRKLFE